MARYDKLDKDYVDLRRKFGGKSKILETNYHTHVPSTFTGRFQYLLNGIAHKVIPYMPVSESKKRANQRIIDLERSKRNRGLAQLARDSSRTLDILLPSLGIIAGFFLLSGNITGNAIGNITRNDANLAGAFAIVVGIVGLLISRRR
ncbi:MAG: hypothetical protein AABX93_03435 [Nanoarchaeota archaeon]